MNLYEKLGVHNRVYWHWMEDDPSIRDKAVGAHCYILSANALSENGEIINIDGTGNRVAAAIYGPRKVFYIVGVNKITPDLESALYRARSVASPKNAKRLHVNTPCAVKGDKCYHCQSEDKICAVTTITERAPGNTEVCVLLVGQNLGY